MSRHVMSWHVLL